MLREAPSFPQVETTDMNALIKGHKNAQVARVLEFLTRIEFTKDIKKSSGRVSRFDDVFGYDYGPLDKAIRENPALALELAALVVALNRRIVKNKHPSVDIDGDSYLDIDTRKIFGEALANSIEGGEVNLEKLKENLINSLSSPLTKEEIEEARRVVEEGINVLDQRYSLTLGGKRIGVKEYFSSAKQSESYTENKEPKAPGTQVEGQVQRGVAASPDVREGVTKQAQEGQVRVDATKIPTAMDLSNPPRREEIRERAREELMELARDLIEGRDTKKPERIQPAPLEKLEEKSVEPPKRLENIQGSGEPSTQTEREALEKVTPLKLEKIETPPNQPKLRTLREETIVEGKESVNQVQKETIQPKEEPSERKVKQVQENVGETIEEVKKIEENLERITPSLTPLKPEMLETQPIGMPTTLRELRLEEGFGETPLQKKIRETINLAPYLLLIEDIENGNIIREEPNRNVVISRETVFSFEIKTASLNEGEENEIDREIIEKIKENLRQNQNFQQLGRDELEKIAREIYNYSRETPMFKTFPPSIIKIRVNGEELTTITTTLFLNSFWESIRNIENIEGLNRFENLNLFETQIRYRDATRLARIISLISSFLRGEDIPKAFSFEQTNEMIRMLGEIARQGKLIKFIEGLYLLEKFQYNRISALVNLEEGEVEIFDKMYKFGGLVYADFKNIFSPESEEVGEIDYITEEDRDNARALFLYTALFYKNNILKEEGEVYVPNLNVFANLFEEYVENINFENLQINIQPFVRERASPDVVISRYLVAEHLEKIINIDISIVFKRFEKLRERLEK